VRVQIYGIPFKMFRFQSEISIGLNVNELCEVQLNDNKHYVKCYFQKKREPYGSLTFSNFAGITSIICSS